MSPKIHRGVGYSSLDGRIFRWNRRRGRALHEMIVRPRAEMICKRGQTKERP
jgi:hypothetical protein